MKITKLDIQRKLENYHFINKLFSKSLNDRPPENWFRNIIIHRLYRNTKPLEHLEEILSLVFNRVENSSFLKAKLNGKEADFDEKVWHVYAEILASKWFIDAGFERIIFLEEGGSRPTPDIELRKSDVTHFAEVKYLELTADELLPILSKLEELVIQYPEIYDKKIFIITVYLPSLIKLQRIRKKRERDDLVDQLIKNLHETILTKRTEIEGKLSEKNPYTIELKDFVTVKFEIKKYHQYGAIFWHPQIYGSQITAGTEFYHYGPLYAKLIGRIHEGYLQLLTNRGDNFDLVKRDFIYLFIEQKPSDISYEEEVDGKIDGLLNTLQIGDLVQIITNRSNILKVDKQICPVFSTTVD